MWALCDFCLCMLGTSEVMVKGVGFVIWACTEGNSGL